VKPEQPAQPAPPPADPNAPPEATDPTAEADGATVIREMKFQPGDEAVLDRQTAAEVVKAGVAEYVESRPDEKVYSHVYRRPLNDYPVAFREVRSQLLATQVKLAEVARQIDATQKSIELAKQTLQLRQQEVGRLAQDLEKFRFEGETIQKQHAALVISVKSATDEMTSLKQSIDSQSEQLVRLQLKAAEAIDRRTGATAAARAQ
jgi:chromosome segregation ATPase